MTFAEHFAKMWWAYAVIVCMIMLSAYFSASEIAFNSANKMRLRRAADAGSATARIAFSITERFTTALSAILIGNNLANIAVSTCSTLIILNLFKNNVALAPTSFNQLLVSKGLQVSMPKPLVLYSSYNALSLP